MDKNFGAKFGALVREKRLSTGRLQSEIECALKLGQGYLSHLEKGEKAKPAHRKVVDLTNHLLITPSELAACRGDPVPSVDLRYAAWLSSRVGRRRFLHPRGIGGEDPQPLVATSTSSDIASLIETNPTVHILIEGEIASGKSSMVELLTSEWKKKHPRGNVYVLPLGGDYSTGNNWRTSVAVRDFQDLVIAVSRATNLETLFVIEDAHELHVDNRSRYVFDASDPVDFSRSSLIVSSRPSYIERVKSDLKSWAKTELEHFKTNSKETAELIISAAVTDSSRRHDFEDLFVRLGGSLVALGAALYEADIRKDDPVTVHLAFKAVRGELDRICDPEGGVALNEDPARLKVGLLNVWMLGALETEFDHLTLARLMNELDVTAQLRVFESNKEIFLVGEDLYRCGRHPAWGQLVMQAIDEHKPLQLLSSELERRAVASALRPELAKTLKTLTSFLFAVLYQKVVAPDRLGFICTGRHMHEEYVEAGRLYIEGGISRLGPIDDRLPTLLQISSGIRRCNPRDFEQRQALLDEAGEIIREAIRVAKDEYGVENEPELPGPVLYELAYLHSLRGDLTAAMNAFRWSKLNDLGKPNRIRYGIMSGVRESIMLTYLGDRTEATQCLNDLEPLLERLEGEPAGVGSELMRFRANFLHARLEIALAGRNPGEARRIIKDYIKAAETSLSPQDSSLYMARVALNEENFDGAKALSIKALSQPANVNSAEGFNLSNRVHGDAYLGLGVRDAAILAYRVVLPETAEPPRHKDVEMQLVEERLTKINQGLRGDVILRSVRI